MVKKKSVFIFLSSFLAAALLLIALVYYLFEIRPAAIVLLRTDIDPVTAIRGRYIALDYEISKIPFDLLEDARPEDIDAGWSNSDIYVVLEKKGKYWEAVSAYKNKPGNTVYIWGRCNSKLHNTFYVRYNIFSLLISKETAHAILKQMLEPSALLDIEVVINRQGKARINRLFVNGKAHNV